MAIIKTTNVHEGVEKGRPYSREVTAGIIGMFTVEISGKGSQKTNTRAII